MAAGDFQGVIRLWDKGSGKLLKTMDAFQGAPKKTRTGCGWLAYTARSSLLSMHGDGVIRYWDVGRGTMIRRLPLKGLRPRHFHFCLAPDNRTAAVVIGPERSRVVLWDLTIPAPLGDVSGHDGEIAGIAFSADSKFLATAGRDDKMVRVWEIATRHEYCCFSGHEGSVLQVAFSPDGLSLALGGQDKTIIIWNLWELEAVIKPTTADKIDLPKLWNDLGDPKPSVAYRAMTLLLKAPAKTTPFLNGYLKPSRKLEKAVVQLIRELDSNEFSVREAARRQLMELSAKLVMLFITQQNKYYLRKWAKRLLT